MCFGNLVRFWWRGSAVNKHNDFVPSSCGKTPFEQSMVVVATYWFLQWIVTSILQKVNISMISFHVTARLGARNWELAWNQEPRELGCNWGILYNYIISEQDNSWHWCLNNLLFTWLWSPWHTECQWHPIICVTISTLIRGHETSIIFTLSDVCHKTSICTCSPRAKTTA